MSDYPLKHVRLIKRLRKIAKLYKIGFRTAPDLGESGLYLGKQIWVSRDQDAREFVSSFFHEIGHAVAHRSGKFKSFYSDHTPLYVKRNIALRAERHADRIGEGICKKYFPKFRYRKSYVKPVDVDWLKSYYRDMRYSEILPRRTR